MNIKISILLIAIIGFSFSLISEAQENPPNILFIAVDDLNCDFGAYGNPWVRSPNLNELANQGILFANNHAQKAVCGPSRASLLSGFTPEHTGVTGFHIYLRDLYPDIITLPQFFKNKGYTTVGMGKIHDPRNVSVNDNVDLVSWSQFINVDGNRYAISSGKPVVEMADVSDEDYLDGQLAREGINQIAELSAKPEPFFLAVGFKKPHLPFAAPKRYWDLYDRDSIPLAPFRRFAENDRAFVHNPGAEFRNNYDNVPQEGEFPYDLQREYIHGYYACVSYIDKLVGQLIDALKEQGVYENTLIVLWGDHGFSLGDHTNWGKHTNFEYATRCPLIISGPGLEKAKIIESPTELLDIYPTLVDLAGYAVPDTLDGNSLKPILTGAKQKVKSFAISQFRRDGKQGFALRSDYFQYVEWKDNNVTEHQQLFNFVQDPYQTINLSLDPDYIEIRDTFSLRLNEYLETGENTAPVLLTEETDSLKKYRKFHRVNISVFETNRSGTFSVNDAEVNIGEFSLPTSKIGYNSLLLPPGIYNFTIEKSNYYPVSGSFTLKGDTLLQDTLQRQFYSLNVIIRDAETGISLSGASVKSGDKLSISDLDGNAEFSLEPGNYNLEIIMENYRNKAVPINLGSDTLISIELQPSNASLKFKLRDGITPVNNAEIRVNDVSYYSNSLGMVTLNNLPVDSLYSWSIVKEGYEKLSGELILESDTTIEMVIIPETFNVSFEIRDTADLNLIENAEILFRNEMRRTNESGLANYEGILGGFYNWSVEKDGFETKIGTIEIKNDTSIIIYLSWPMSISLENKNDVVISPVPAQDFIHIRTDLIKLNFKIISIEGKSLISGSFKSLDKQVDISILAPGIYFILLDSRGKYFSPKIFTVNY